MAKPNYGFEKRQRELAKKKKQDEKNARKREARNAGPGGDATMPDSAPSAPDPAPAGETQAAAEPAAAAPRIHRRVSTGE